MEKVDPGPVKLVVKASNQQFDDLIIECQTTWSVLKLKEHLAEVYPCKPAIPEQKLIYHGKLLNDKYLLQDILRTYDDVEPTNHIFHLVYTPKQRFLTEKELAKQSNDGLRQRNNQRTGGNVNLNSTPIVNQTVTANSSNNNNNNNNGIPSINIPQLITNGTGNCPASSGSYPMGFGNINGGSLLAQQMAMQNWQQVYAQYMNQYMSLLSVGVRPESFFMQNQMPSQTSTPLTFGGALGFGGVIPPQMLFSQPNFPFGTSVPQRNLFGQNAENVVDNNQGRINPTQTQHQIPVPGNGDGGAAGPQVAQQADQQQIDQQPAAAPGRFPQIVQEEQENRDWLDTFYSISRLVVLLILVYFYSSPLRCLSVLFIAIAIYMYHIGYFRNQINGPAEANNNNNNNNNNNRPVEAVIGNLPGNPQGNQPNGEVVAAGTVAASANVDTTSNLVPETENNGTTVIAFIRTFVVTFFTSLLPETPAL